MKLHKILTFMTVIATVPVWGAAGDDHITLTIRPADSHNISVEQNGDSYIITTTGNDPYVFLDADRPVDISHYRMLEFNSFNTSDILPLALFVGRLDNDHLVEGNLYTLPRTEGWSVNAYDITKTDVPADGPVSWIRIRFGMNGGNRSGIAFAEVDPLGYVHPDQFTQHHTFGNVRERKFGDIWQDTTNPIMAGLKDRKPLLKGRCAKCKFLDNCNGNFRTRAEARTGDFWESDPSCYLTDEEIGIVGGEQ